MVTCAIGIDFGTSGTGYAFAFKESKSEIYAKEPGGQEAAKTKTILLLDKNKQFKSFGSKALEAYYIENHNATDLLLQKFKMNLDTSKSKINMRAQALNGETVPLEMAIQKTLEYLKQEAMQEINRSQVRNPLKLKDIQWVVTVPAIWSDDAKGIMRRAAYTAGLIESESSNRLELVLEPEAACIACETENSQLREGDTFMVLDCGGGTVDITMHRVAQKRPALLLDEIRSPSGGAWGSTFVDDEFDRFVERLIGPERFRRFKPSSSWVEVMKAWESAKHSFSPEDLQGTPGTPKAVNVSGVMEVVDDATLKQLAERYNARHGGDLGVRGKSVLLLPPAMIEGFFRPAVSRCVDHVAQLLQAHDARFIFLVGGFAESKYLQHRVKAEFERGGRRVLVPLRPGLAVVKGAVMLGLGASERFASRLAKRTYGVKCCTEYEPGNPAHAGRRRFSQVEDGRDVTNVGDVFSPIVKHGARVALKEVHRGCPIQVIGSVARRSLELYAADSADAQWVTEPGVARLGAVDYTARVGDQVRVDLCFGASEIRATVVNQTTGEETPAVIRYDFRDVDRGPVAPPPPAAAPAPAPAAGGANTAARASASRPTSATGEVQRTAAGGASAAKRKGAGAGGGLWKRSRPAVESSSSSSSSDNSSEESESEDDKPIKKGRAD